MSERKEICSGELASDASTTETTLRIHPISVFPPLCRVNEECTGVNHCAQVPLCDTKHRGSVSSIVYVCAHMRTYNTIIDLDWFERGG